MTSGYLIEATAVSDMIKIGNEITQISFIPESNTMKVMEAVKQSNKPPNTQIFIHSFIHHT